MERVSELLVRLYWLDYFEVKGFTQKRLLLAKNKASSKIVLNKLIAKRLIKKKSGSYCLTGLGKKKIEKRFPLWKKRMNEWDRAWRFVVFDLPIKTGGLRISLRRFLFYLGFGLVQRSVLVSPYDWFNEIKEWLESYDLKQPASNMILLLKSVDFDLNPEHYWPLDELARDYQIAGKEESVFAQFEKLLVLFKIDPWLPVNNVVDQARKVAIQKFLSRL